MVKNKECCMNFLREVRTTYDNFDYDLMKTVIKKYGFSYFKRYILKFSFYSLKYFIENFNKYIDSNDWKKYFDYLFNNNLYKEFFSMKSFIDNGVINVSEKLKDKINANLVALKITGKIV
jgi:hypothetical protein